MTTDLPRPAATRWVGAVGAVAAVAAVIAVPTFIFSNDESRSGSSASGTDHSALALRDHAVGEAPSAGYLLGDEFRTNSDRVRLPLTQAAVEQFTALSGGYLLSTRDELGDSWVRFVAGDGRTVGTWQVDHGNFLPTFVVSSDRTLGAVVKADGTTVVIEDGGRTLTELPAPGADGGFEPIAVTGHSCHGAAPDCAVLVHGPSPVGDDGRLRRTWMVRPGRAAVPAGGEIGEVRAAATNGFTAGVTKVIEDGDGACAGVADTGGSVLWTTCKDRMIAFSPNANLILASTSALWGSGDHELTILDATSGDERLRLRTAKNVGVYEMLWEDDEHVLAVVSDWRIDPATESHTDIRWAVLRIGLDGRREYAVEPVAGQEEDYDGPLDLARG